jgi:hypothetical protein
LAGRTDIVAYDDAVRLRHRPRRLIIHTA